MTMEASTDVAETSAGVHVVVFPFPTAGHTTPFVHFARSLARRGVAVTFMAPQLKLASLRQSLTDDASFEARRNIDILSFDIPDIGELDTVKVDMLKHFMYSEAGKFDALVGRLMEAPRTAHYPSLRDAGPPVCIISDMFLGYTQDTAAKFNIPRYCLFTSPAHFLSLFFHLVKFNTEGRIPIRMADDPLVIPNFPPIPPGDMPPSQHAGVGPPDAHHFLRDEAKSLWKSACVLVNTVSELESDVLQGLCKFLRESTPNSQVPRILTVGPVMEGIGEGPLSLREALRAGPAESGECFDWLSRQPDASVLYVSFGSVAQLSGTQARALAAGLEASGQRFFWVMRAPEGGVAGALPEGFLERTDGRGFVYSEWAPQLHILAHPAVGGFVTHCGWNSVVEAAMIGVPMIAWPFQAEQMLNATLIANALGIAVRINTQGAWSGDGVGSDAFERAIKLLMVDAAGAVMRKRVLQVSDAIERAVRPGGSSHENVAQFVRDLHSLGAPSAPESLAN